MEGGVRFKNDLTAPTLLEMSDYRCELNRSTQHTVISCSARISTEELLFE